ncbi:hypothetical protein LJ739_07285 [Aestuariibacter halophilus]|uniref:Uncharacterized protein n=1 Tax=Fluctibacter halophilus TaxID=226011 RepID=A0ABS8G6C4_9ALTE|nr:hypothetical protein [Aestuariibacter halophilus]MCC2616039.1 hypothetical protein [Aestuariibacter halophilus]
MPYSTHIRWLSFLTLTICLYVGNLLWVLPSTLPANLIALTLVLDWALWVPVTYYLLLVRHRLAPAMLTRLLFAIGLLAAFWQAPQQSLLSEYAPIYRMALLCVAGGWLLLSAWRLYLGMRHSRHLQGESRIEHVARRVAGKNSPLFANLLAQEWLTWYYAIMGWRLNTACDQVTRFSYHQKSGHSGMLIGIAVFHLPSLVFSHIIFANLFPLLAWLLTIGHVYTLQFTLAQAMAVRHRPIILSDHGLTIRCGLLFDTFIPWQAIRSVESLAGRDNQSTPGVLQASMFGHANVAIKLTGNTRLSVFAGLCKTVHTVHVGVDQRGEFLQACQHQQHNLSEQ